MIRNSLTPLVFTSFNSTTTLTSPNFRPHCFFVSSTAFHYRLYSSMLLSPPKRTVAERNSPLGYHILKIGGSGRLSMFSRLVLCSLSKLCQIVFFNITDLRTVPNSACTIRMPALISRISL